MGNKEKEGTDIESHTFSENKNKRSKAADFFESLDKPDSKRSKSSNVSSSDVSGKRYTKNKEKHKQDISNDKRKECLEKRNSSPDRLKSRKRSRERDQRRRNDDRDGNVTKDSSRYGRKEERRRRRSSSSSSRRRSKELTGSRYWKDEANKDENKNSEKKKYEVGPRYYEDKPRKKADGNLLKENYVVGSRYYDDKPKSVERASKDVAPTAPQTRPTKKSDDVFTLKTGGAYIPPAKLKLMQASITDKSSIAYQRIAWEALKKSIHGHINKVNTSNIGIIARLLMKENIVRGRGLLCRSILQAQAASPTFTNVYASLVNIINSKFPNIGELLLKRVILQFKRGFKRNDKPLCIASCQFIAHLVNQQVAHEIIALEVLTLLLETPTDDSVEVAVAFLKECGQKLLEVSPKGSNAIFDMLRNILHEGSLDKRTQYMIEVVFQVRKDDFRSFPSIAENLDLVEEEDQYTHILTLDEAVDSQDLLNVFKHDPSFEENEEKYKALKVEIIGESSSEGESDEDGESGSSEEESDEDKENSASGAVTIVDNTETNLVALRRTIYLTIQSSLDFEECCHKLLKMDIKPGQEAEVCHMLLDCCAELRSYEKFFGLLAQRFCRINHVYVTPLEEMFKSSYATVHRLDTNRLRNVARFFAHLLYTDAISWQVLETIHLNEEETTSSSRIFIKILFQELSEYMGLSSLNQRLKDPTFQSSMEGLFPRDNPKNTRFSINFFTSIGLGGLTDELREHLKSQPKPSLVPQLVDQLSSDSDSEQSSTSSSESSSSESSDDESEEEVKKKKKGTNNTNSNKKVKSKQEIKSKSSKQKEYKSNNGKESSSKKDKMKQQAKQKSGRW